MSLVGGLDRVTPAAEVSGYLNRIPRVRTHVIANARHDLLNEIEPVLTETWHHIRKLPQDGYASLKLFIFINISGNMVSYLH